MPEFVVSNARLPGNDGLVDIAVSRGRIAAIQPTVESSAPAVDAGGGLVLPGFVETHLHLDKSCILERCSGDGATLAAAIARVSDAKREFTVEDVHARARRTLEKAIGQGTNLIRTHVEIDPVIGLRGFEAIMRLKREYAWALDLQVCVFPQEGLTNRPGTDALLVQCLERGADLLGGCPYTDADPHAQIDWCFRTASEFDVDLDFHLDFDLDAGWMHLDEVLRQSDEHRRGGRVAVGHVTKLSVLTEARLSQVAERLRDAGVAVTALPSTDLFLMGRDAGPMKPRGVAPVHALAAYGVTCSLATNNVLNPFTPFGDGSLTRIANLYANIAQIGDMEGLAGCLDLVVASAARLVGRGDTHAVRPGGPATFVLLDVASPAMAVAEIARPTMGFRDGRQTFAHPAPVLFPPRAG